MSDIAAREEARLLRTMSKPHSNPSMFNKQPNPQKTPDPKPVIVTQNDKDRQGVEEKRRQSDWFKLQQQLEKERNEKEQREAKEKQQKIHEVTQQLQNHEIEHKTEVATGVVGVSDEDERLKKEEMRLMRHLSSKNIDSDEEEKKKLEKIKQKEIEAQRSEELMKKAGKRKAEYDFLNSKDPAKEKEEERKLQEEEIQRKNAAAQKINQLFEVIPISSSAIFLSSNNSCVVISIFCFEKSSIFNP